jgi:hypothetical protein
MREDVASDLTSSLADLPSLTLRVVIVPKSATSKIRRGVFTQMLAHGLRAWPDSVLANPGFRFSHFLSGQTEERTVNRQTSGKRVCKQQRESPIAKKDFQT